MADASAMLKTPSTQLTLERRLRERPTHIKPQHGRNYTKLSSSYGLGPTNSFYPDDRDADRTVVIFSADGIMKILGYPSKKELRKPVDEFLRKRKWVCDVESICLGATFAVAATNGLDITRRVNFQVDIDLFLALLCSVSAAAHFREFACWLSLLVSHMKMRSPTSLQAVSKF